MKYISTILSYFQLLLTEFKHNFYNKLCKGIGKVTAQAFHHHPLFLNSFSVKGLSWFLAAFFWVKSSSPLLKNPLSRASFIDSKGKFWAHFTWSLSSRSPTKVKVSRESFAVKAPKIKVSRSRLRSLRCWTYLVLTLNFRSC